MLPIVIVPFLLLAGPALSASGIPRLNIESTCRAAQGLMPGDRSPYDTCMRDEKEALAELEKEWNTFAAQRQQMCTEETHIGSYPSYVELLVCLQMANGGSRITAPPDASQKEAAPQRK